MTDKARQLYEEGLAAIQKSKWLEARASLVAAWSLTKHWQIAANLAGCELELGKYRDAAEHSAYYLKNAPPDRTAKAEAQLNRAKEKVGTLTVAVESAGAEVLVDDVAMGQSPLRHAIYLDPGAHRVLVRRSGRPDLVQGVTLGAGESKAITMKEEAQVPPPPTTPQKRSIVPAIVAGGVGLVAAGIGVGLVVDAGAKGSSAQALNGAILKAHRSCVTGAPNYDATCAQLHSTTSAGDTRGNAGVGLLAVAGAAAAGAVIYAIWPAPKASATGSRGFRLAPAVSATNGGVLFSGTF